MATGRGSVVGIGVVKSTAAFVEDEGHALGTRMGRIVDKSS